MQFRASRWFQSALGTFTRRRLFAGGAAALAPALEARERLLYEDSIYQRLLGVRPILTCRGHTTAFGGSRMPPEVLRALEQANDVFVDMGELQAAAGRRIASLMKTEAAMVSAGSFSAMLLGAAACLTLKDPAKIDALPHPTWPRREVVIQKAHRVVYDRAYRAAGANIVEVVTREQFLNAISANTAMLAALASADHAPAAETMSIQEYIEIGRRTGVPVLVDAASELPPVTNLHRWSAADLVVFSGGKGLQGPQSTGILAGRKELIEAALLNASPHASIGRGMKVGKEEIVALVVALERYAMLDHETVIASWNKKARFLAEQLHGIPGFTATYRLNRSGFGEVRIDWDQRVIPLTGKQAAEKLLNGEPRIMYYDDDTGGVLQTRCMNDGDEILAARRLRRFFLSEARTEGAKA